MSSMPSHNRTLVPVKFLGAPVEPVAPTAAVTTVTPVAPVLKAPAVRPAIRPTLSPVLASPVPLSKVNPQRPVIKLSALQPVLRFGGRLDRGEIGVREAAGPAGGAVDGDPHVIDVTHALEEPV